jgi:hypothetical protein
LFQLGFIIPYQKLVRLLFLSFLFAKQKGLEESLFLCEALLFASSLFLPFFSRSEEAKKEVAKKKEKGAPASLWLLLLSSLTYHK